MYIPIYNNKYFITCVPPVNKNQHNFHNLNKKEKNLRKNLSTKYILPTYIIYYITTLTHNIRFTTYTINYFIYHFNITNSYKFLVYI